MIRKNLPSEDDFLRADVKLKILISLTGKNNINKIKEEIENLFKKDMVFSSWLVNMKKETDIIVKSTESEEIRRIENIVSSMKLGSRPRTGTNYNDVKKALNGYDKSGGKRGPRVKIKAIAGTEEAEVKKVRVYGLVEGEFVNRDDTERFFGISNKGLMRVVTYFINWKMLKPKDEMNIEW